MKMFDAVKEVLTFSNWFHVIYFVGTISAVVMAWFSLDGAALEFYGFHIGNTDGSQSAKHLLSAAMFASISFTAYYLVIIKKIETKAFTFDCIWYNALLCMTFISFAIYTW